MHRRLIRLPRGSQFKECVSVFEAHLQKGDGAILPIFRAFPLNDDFPMVLAKCALLNALYNTQVLSLERMANHVHQLKIDSRLIAGDRTLVDDIRRGHGIKTRSGVDRDFLSFASKYCSFHALDAFPIFDNLLADLIHDALIRPEVIQPRVSRPALRDYATFHEAVCATRNWLGVEDLNFKQLDKGLWLLAKFFYRPQQLARDLRAAVARIAARAGRLQRD